MGCKTTALFERGKYGLVSKMALYRMDFRVLFKLGRKVVGLIIDIWPHKQRPYIRNLVYSISHDSWITTNHCNSPLQFIHPCKSSLSNSLSRDWQKPDKLHQNAAKYINFVHPWRRRANRGCKIDWTTPTAYLKAQNRKIASNTNLSPNHWGMLRRMRELGFHFKCRQWHMPFTKEPLVPRTCSIAKTHRYHQLAWKILPNGSVPPEVMKVAFCLKIRAKLGHKAPSAAWYYNSSLYRGTLP